MTIKHSVEVESKEIAAGKDSSIQVLISAQEAPHFAMRKITILPGGGMPLHTNTVEHEQYILSGRVRIGIGAEVYEAQQGDAVFIPEGVPHFYENIGNEPFVFLCLIPNKEDRITIVNAANC